MSAATKLDFAGILSHIAEGKPVTWDLGDDRGGEALPIRLVCMDCRRVLREGANPPSHGLCEACGVARGLDEQIDVLRPEHLVPGESDAEVEAALERCAEVEADAFPEDAIAGAARNAGRTARALAGFVGGLLFAIASYYGARVCVRALMGGGE